MRQHVHVQLTGRSGGTTGAFDGWVDGVDAIVKCADRPSPLTDPRSAFYGGQGLLPPFRPLVHHEALVWARVEPGRLLAYGVGSEGPYTALRRLRAVALSDLRGEVTFGAGFVEAVIAHVATELSALHSAGVVHRDLRPEKVLLVDGRARLAGLERALLDGCGPPRAGGVGSATTDLAGLGALGRWMLGERPEKRVGGALAQVLAALWAPDPGDRPTSANEILRALGEPEGPPAALPPAHPALLAWGGVAWADRLLAQGHVWDVVRGADEADLDRWALAAVAGRLLSAPRNTEGWLALGTLCWMLAQRTTGAERDAFRAQAVEANARARAPWHTASKGLVDLLGLGETVGALCDTAQFSRATRRAHHEGGGGALALVGFCADDPSLIEDGLLDAAPEDLDAVRVAASQLLSTSPREAPLSAARLALPRAQLDAVRRLCVMAAEPDAIRLAGAYPEPTATRARLTIAHHMGERSEALAIARVLAMSGNWDTTVAATLVAHAPDGEPLQVQARRILRGLLRREDPGALGGAAAEAAAADPTDLVAWSGLVYARVAAGEVDRVVGELERAGPTVSAGVWRLLVQELIASGALDQARVVALGALRRHPNDSQLATIDAALELLDGDLGAAQRAASHARTQDPRSVFGWLAGAACALWAGDGPAAREALAAAARLGARDPAHRALEDCMPGLD
ncbi:MAG: hypothetical protein Q8P18_22345 [Pseudomonadota bacterium]|nr:hypothetical protein [Pseudomonadota bacterium]